MIANHATLGDPCNPAAGWILSKPAIPDGPAERRTRGRYPIKMTLRYRRIGRLSEHFAKGHTTDLSPDGVFIFSETKRLPEIDSRLEISMDWPVRLNGDIPLQLVAQGRVVRMDARGFAVAIDRHELRTARRKPNLSYPDFHALTPAVLPSQVAPTRSRNANSFG